MSHYLFLFIASQTLSETVSDGPGTHRVGWPASELGIHPSSIFPVLELRMYATTPTFGF